VRVLHLIGGKEAAGSKNHLIPLLNHLDKTRFYLCVFEEGEISAEAERLGIKVFYLKQKSRYDLSVLKKLKGIMIRERIDILHTHGARANVYAYFLSRLLRFDWMTTVHSDPRYDFIDKGMKGWLFSKINLFVLKRAQHIFAISRKFKRILIRLGITPEKITVIYNGISFDTEYRKRLDVTREKLGLGEGDFIIVTVGRLHPIKGHPYLFKAVRECLKKDPSLKLLVVGSGGSYYALRRLAKQLQIENHVLFLGHKDPVFPYYRLADVEVLPSLSESFPLVILEAARERLPVIATDVGGVRDLISSRQYGWVVPPKNAEALAKAISEAMALKKSGQLAAIGRNLYDKASRQYSLQQLTGKILDTYLQIHREKWQKS